MILLSVRLYLAYSLSYRNIEEMMKERGFEVDHSTIQRWVVHYHHVAKRAIGLNPMPRFAQLLR